MEKNKKKHHYIPRYYLKGFTQSSTSNKIWVYEKGKQKVFRSNIMNVAFENYYYAFINHNGSRDTNTYENWLANDIEGPANTTIQKIRAKQNISLQEKEALAIYINAMLKRVPKHRERITRIYPKVITELETQIKANYYKVLNSEDRKIEALQVLKKLTLNAPDQIFLPSVSPILSAIIFSMNWQVLVSTGERNFITSDNPFAFDEGLGLGDQKAEITFPISSDTALWISWQHKTDMEYVETTPSIVDQVNFRSLKVASKYVYCSSNQQWLLDIVYSK